MNFDRVANRPGLSRTHTQVLLAIALVVIQFVVLFALSHSAQEKTNLVYITAIGSIVATLLGIFLIKGVSHYPGVEESSYILPGFCLSYGALLLVFIFARLEYSRILLTTGFTINVAMFLIIYSVLRRQTQLRIGLVPEGDYTALLEVRNIGWHVLDHPGADVQGLDAISADLRSDMPDQWERQLAQFALRGLPVYHSKHLKESLTGKVEVEHLSENSFGTLTPLSAYMGLKHAVDLLAAIACLILFSPVLAVVAVMIRLDSPGPVFFRQVRIGYQGRPFRVFKFRTMTAAPDAGTSALDAAMTKQGDRRITRFGGFLRRSRLDELPQLLNVIVGEMSWIGPRPEAEILSRWYEEEIPFYHYRHIVRPGITGWAQVNQGHVAEVSEVRAKLHYDFYYIKNFSPWIDLLIVVRTVRTMLTGFGSR